MLYQVLFAGEQNNGLKYVLKEQAKSSMGTPVVGLNF